ncbi:MAG: putative C-S lyase [Chloroflexi bacterium]|nr:putative C-S lyase [Chloroflexota bacterium]
MKYDFDRVIERKTSECAKWTSPEYIGAEPDAIPLSIADMDFESPAPVIDALHARVAHRVLGYPARPQSFFDAIIAWMHTRQRWDIQQEWLTFTPGVVPALNLAVQAFSQPGDAVIVQTPVYYPFLFAIKNNGRQLIANQLKVENDRYGMDFETLAQQITPRTRLLILCSPHNPVGRVWTRDELTRLGEICRAHNVLIVSDEIHSDLIFPGHTHTPLAAISDELAQITLTLNAPSKTFNLAGLFTSFAIIPNPQLRARFNIALENTGIGANNLFGIVAAEAAYRDGAEWLSQVLDYIATNARFVADYFAACIPQIKVTPLEGTYLLWLDFRGLGLGDAEITALLKRARVAMNDGAMFGAGGEGFRRMNIACPRATLTDALQRIERAVNHS